MFCRDCGKQLSDGAQFCDGCGARQQAVAEATSAAKRSRAGVVIAAVVALVVLLGAGLGWVVFLRPTNPSDYESRVSDAVEGVLDVPADIATTLNDVGAGSGDEMGEQDLATLRTTIDESTKMIADARDKVDALRPPSEYKRAHDDVLAALDELSAVAKEYTRILDAIAPEDTQSEVASEFSDRFYASAEDAYRAYGDLSDALDDMGVSVFDVEQLFDEDLYY